MTGRHLRTHHRDGSQPEGEGTEPANARFVPADGPRFAQPEITPEPNRYLVRHRSDGPAYKILDEEARAHELQPMAFPKSRGDGDEPVLTLAQIYGSSGEEIEKQVTALGQLVFHAVGDTGNTKGPSLQEQVTDKMIGDFVGEEAASVPWFFFHLGDVVYSFGETRYYYDQFYDAYRNYPAPIVALAGNHDGMVSPFSNAPTLEAFLRNFCAETFGHTPESGSLDRTAQIQPGVYFTFEAPLLRILCLYSNTLEDPGVLSSQGGAFPEVPDYQIDYLEAALTRVKRDGFEGALIIAHHHPTYTLAGERGHGSSTAMREEIDRICEETGVWPHAVLSAHAHNMQRYTRVLGEMEIPYLIAGGGGHSHPQKVVRHAREALRTPYVIPTAEDEVTLESYDQTDLGYLRIVVTAEQLTIEYHRAGDGTESKTPHDQVTVDLQTHRLAHRRG